MNGGEMSHSNPLNITSDPIPRRWALNIIKGSRNLIADSVAALVFAIPSLERLYIKIGPLLSRRPLVWTFYRRCTDTLTTKLRESGRFVRRIPVGPLAVQFDITEFTTKGLYFAAIPYEPQTTQHILHRLKPGN